MTACTVVAARSHWTVVTTSVMHTLHTPSARHEVGLEGGENHPQDKGPCTHKGERHMMPKKAASLVPSRSERLSRSRLRNHSHSSLPHGIVDPANAHLLSVHVRPDGHNELLAAWRSLVGLHQLGILYRGL